MPVVGLGPAAKNSVLSGWFAALLPTEMPQMPACLTGAIGLGQRADEGTGRGVERVDGAVAEIPDQQVMLAASKLAGAMAIPHGEFSAPFVAMRLMK